MKRKTTEVRILSCLQKKCRKWRLLYKAASHGTKLWENTGHMTSIWALANATKDGNDQNLHFSLFHSQPK